MLHFDDCRVPHDAMLGDEGSALWQVAFECFDWERCVMIASSIGSPLWGFMTCCIGSKVGCVPGVFGGYGSPTYPLCKVKGVDVFEVMKTHPEKGASGNGTRVGGPANWEEFTQWQWVTIQDRATPYPI